MGEVVRFPRHGRLSAGSRARGPAQSSAKTAPPLNALILSMASQSGLTKRLRYRLTLTRLRSIAAATSSSDRSRDFMKSERCMDPVVHRAHNVSQAECTPGVVLHDVQPVHSVYMGKAKRNQLPNPEPELAWRRTCMQHWRKHARITQEEAAKALDTTHASIGRYESGKQLPDAKTLEALAKLYNTDIHSMLNRLPPVTDGRLDTPSLDDEFARLWDDADVDERAAILAVARTMTKARRKAS